MKQNETFSSRLILIALVLLSLFFRTPIHAAEYLATDKVTDANTEMMAAPLPPAEPEDFSVGNLFRKYARNSKARLVNLDNKVLARKGGRLYGIDGLTRVMALTLKEPTEEMVLDVTRTIETDKQGSDDIQEVFAQGYLISAYYRLSQLQSESVYLLYRYDIERNRITLIYLQGRINNRQLLNMLHKK